MISLVRAGSSTVNSRKFDWPLFLAELETKDDIYKSNIDEAFDTLFGYDD